MGINEIHPYGRIQQVYAEVGKFAALPANSKAVEIFKLFDDQVELAVTLKKTPEEALKEAAEKGNEILGNQ